MKSSTRMDARGLADQYDEQRYIDIAWDSDAEELAFVIEVLRERPKMLALLQAWVAGCGDEHFSTKEQCRELLEQSGQFLASLYRASKGSA